MKNNFWSLPVVAIVGLFLLLTSCQNTPKNEEQIRLINALNDSIRHYKSEKGNLVAKISTFETEKTETILNLQNKDKEITALRNLVKKNNAKIETLMAEKKQPPTTNYNYRRVVTDSVNSTVTMSASSEDAQHYIWFKATTPLNDKVGHHFRNEKGEKVSHYFYGGNGRGQWEYIIKIVDSLVIQHKKDSLGRMYVEVENMNPYSVSPAVRSYYKTQPD